MSDDIKEILINAGMKEKKAFFLLKFAERKKISVSRAFFIYFWKYYTWGGALFVSMLFPATLADFELFIIYMLCCLALVLVSICFTPFFIILVWSLKVQIKLIGK